MNRTPLELVPRKGDAPRAEEGAPILVAEDLRKLYGPREALKGLTFTLGPTRVLGFLGPNGAGKTTAIRILTTIMEPTSGRFTVDGVGSDQPDEIRRRIGVLPESLGFPKQITGIEFLTYFGQLYGRTAAEARAKGMGLLEEFGLQNRARSLIGSYSRGMRQRLGIARALVNDPAVVFLDEPTLGLDPRGQQELLAQIRQVAERRSAGVVLCTHHLSDVEGVCDDVVILSSGEVVATGTVAEVIGGTQRNGNVVRVHVPSESIAQAQRILEEVSGVLRVTATSGISGWLRVEMARSADGAPDDPADRNRLLDGLIRANIPILSFDSEGGRLQDVFLQLTAGGIK